jgi:hypothetical protein
MGRAGADISAKCRRGRCSEVSEQTMSSTSEHENKIQGIEDHRRKLLDDYYQMKSVRAKPIEDAVVLGEE